MHVPFSTLADTVLERLTATYAAAADPERAESMRARGARYALQTMCEAGGLANAMVLEGV